MVETRRTARAAGVLYLLVVLTGVFAVMYAPSRLFVRGDSAATVARILAHESLFRLHVVVGFVSELLFIALVLVLYRLLENVGRVQAVVMVLLVLTTAPLAFLSTANMVATLALVRGNDLLAVFDKPQREALSLLFLNVENEGALVTHTFWGLWLLPLGHLVLRSGFLPRLLGAWLIVNGCAYVALGLTGLMWPESVATAARIAGPALLGELAFLSWLLAVGARVPQATEAR